MAIFFFAILFANCNNIATNEYVVVQNPFDKSIEDIECAAFHYLCENIDSMDYYLNNKVEYSGEMKFSDFSAIVDSGLSIEILPYVLVNQYKFNSEIPYFEIWNACAAEREQYPEGLKIGLEYLKKGVTAGRESCMREYTYYKNHSDMTIYPVDTIKANVKRFRILFEGDTTGIEELRNAFAAEGKESFIIPFYLVLIDRHHREEFRKPLLEILKKYSDRYPQARKLMNEYKK